MSSGKVGWCLLLCLCSAICDEKQLFNKCCQLNEAYSEEEKICKPITFQDRDVGTELQWIPLVYSDEDEDYVSLKPGEYNYKYGTVPKCEPGFDMEERIYNASNHGEVAIGNLGNDQYGARLLYHSDQPGVPLENMCVDHVSFDDNMTTTVYVVKMCLQPICKKKICVRKCCTNDHLLHYESYAMNHTMKCIKANRTSWNPDIYQIHRYSAERIDTDSDNINLLIGLPISCNRTYQLDPTSDIDDSFYLNATGDLYIPRMGIYISRDNYCVDEVQGYGNVAFVCAPKDGAKRSPWYSEEMKNAIIPYSIAAILSQVCLVLTVAVYILIPQLRNFQGYLLLNLAAGLFGALFFNTSSQLGNFANVSTGLCKAVAILTHYFFMSTFFWLSVMSFDLWRTLSQMKVIGGNVGAKEIKRLYLYALYAWGSPGVISIITMIMDFAPGISPFYLKPYFAHNSCWFLNSTRLFAYFMGPMSIVMLVNVCFLVLTFATLIRVWRETRSLSNEKESRTNKKNRNRFVLYVKIMVIMGSTWIMEIISWAAGGSVYIWFFTDLINLLQGVFIFIIFVCKKNVILLLAKKYPVLRKPTRKVFKESSSGNSGDTSGATSVSTIQQSTGV